jgi:hypothetical protein
MGQNTMGMKVSACLVILSVRSFAHAQDDNRVLSIQVAFRQNLSDSGSNLLESMPLAGVRSHIYSPLAGSQLASGNITT